MARGGARPGAGRPPIRDKYRVPVGKSEKTIAYALPDIAEKLKDAATNGITRTVVKTLPARFVYKLDWLRHPDTNELICGKDGCPKRGRVLAFPEAKPDEKIIVEYHTETLSLDVKAAMYAIDRIHGKAPTVIEEPPEGEEQADLNLPENGTTY